MTTKNYTNRLLLVAILGIGSWGCTVTSGSNDSGASASGSGGSNGPGTSDTGGQTTSTGSGGASANGSGGATTPSSSTTSEGSGGASAKGGQPGSGGTAAGRGGGNGAGGATTSVTALPSGGATGSGAGPGAGGARASGGAIGAGGATSAGGTTGAAGAGGSTPVGNASGPCDIYAAAGFPCVAAHSTVRRLLSTYTGPLYQVRSGGSNVGTGGTTADIGFGADGFANSAAQDTACGTATSCTISVIYDQSGKGNHLSHTLAGGGAKPAQDNEADAKALKATFSGHTVYGVHIPAGVGYRNNKPSGTATGDNPETEYMITSGDYFNGGCCFDYGNMETNSHDNGEGTMEAVYWGNCTIWGRGAGSGPWVMGDLENGLWAGSSSPYQGNTSVTGFKYVTAMIKGDAAGKNHWAIKAGNAQSGTLKSMFDGTRPSARYNPMRKEGAIGLGTGGDNSNGANGNFFEGVMTATFSSDAADDAVQANIVAAYGP